MTSACLCLSHPAASQSGELIIVSVSRPTPGQLRGRAETLRVSLTDAGLCLVSRIAAGLGGRLQRRRGRCPTTSPWFQIPRTPGTGLGRGKSAQAWVPQVGGQGCCQRQAQGQDGCSEDNIMLAGCRWMMGPRRLKLCARFRRPPIVTRMRCRRRSSARFMSNPLHVGGSHTNSTGRCTPHKMGFSAGRVIFFVFRSPLLFTAAQSWVALGEVDMAIGGEQGGRSGCRIFSGIYGMKPGGDLGSCALHRHQPTRSSSITPADDANVADQTPDCSRCSRATTATDRYQGAPRSGIHPGRLHRASGTEGSPSFKEGFAQAGAEVVRQ